MASVPAVELEHCRELALVPGSVFEFTSRFLPRSGFEPLLAKYALKQAVGSIPKGSADDSVKWAKLKWWSEELVADPEKVIREMIAFCGFSTSIILTRLRSFSIGCTTMYTCSVSATCTLSRLRLSKTGSVKN